MNQFTNGRAFKYGTVPILYTPLFYPFRGTIGAMETRFFHAVYFFPRPDAQPGDADELLAGCKGFLANIPGVTYFAVGTPAGTPRDVVDNSYLVALLVGYADQAGHDLYQDHPDHLAFIAACKHLWSRVQVYDTLI